MSTLPRPQTRPQQRCNIMNAKSLMWHMECKHFPSPDLYHHCNIIKGFQMKRCALPMTHAVASAESLFFESCNHRYKNGYCSYRKHIPSS